MSASIWRVLGIEATTDKVGIKYAYASKLKLMDREHDVAGFQRLRDAYEMAMAFARGEIALDGAIERIDADGEVSDGRPADGAPEEVSLNAPVTSGSALELATLTDREIGIAVDEIIAACATLEHSDALMAHLAAMPVLAGIAQVNAVSRALARRVVEIDDIRYPMLAALVERFDWDTIGSGHGFAEEEREALQVFLRRRHLRELIAMRALPIELQTHYDDLIRHVQPPFGFWRALRISSLLLRDLRASIDAIRAAFGSESDLIVAPEAEAFVRSVYSADAPFRIGLATTIGRAYGFSTALIVMLLIVGSIAKGVGWAFAHLLAWWLPLFVGCAIGVGLVRGVQRLFGGRDE
jgi:hypothetical protein